MSPFATLVITAALALGGPRTAPAIPNLSGTWVLQVAQSEFGQIPGPEARTDVIDHQEPRLTIQRAVTAGGESTTANLTYLVDGQPHHNMVGPTELVSVLHWEGEVLVMISTVDSDDGSLTFTDRYALSPDGKTLTQQRTLSVQGQELAQRLVLTRQ